MNGNLIDDSCVWFGKDFMPDAFPDASPSIWAYSTRNTLACVWWWLVFLMSKGKQGFILYWSNSLYAEFLVPAVSTYLQIKVRDLVDYM